MYSCVIDSAKTTHPMLVISGDTCNVLSYSNMCYRPRDLHVSTTINQVHHDIMTFFNVYFAHKPVLTPVLLGPH